MGNFSIVTKSTGHGYEPVATLCQVWYFISEPVSSVVENGVILITKSSFLMRSSFTQSIYYSSWLINIWQICIWMHTNDILESKLPCILFPFFYWLYWLTLCFLQSIDLWPFHYPSPPPPILTSLKSDSPSLESQLCQIPQQYGLLFLSFAHPPGKTLSLLNPAVYIVCKETAYYKAYGW